MPKSRRPPGHGGQPRYDGLYGPHLPARCLLAQACRADGLLGRADARLQHALRAGVEADGAAADRSIFGGLALQGGEAASLEQIEYWMRQMQCHGLKPDLACYNAVLHACSCKGAADVAMAWFSEMAYAGVRPDKESFDSLVCASARGGEAKQAEDALYAMVREGLHPDDATVAALLMWDDEEADGGRGGAEGTASWAYSVVVGAYAASGDLRMVQRWLLEMGLAGARPSSALIEESFGTAVDVRRAMIVAEQAEAARVARAAAGSPAADAGAINWAALGVPLESVPAWLLEEDVTAADELVTEEGNADPGLVDAGEDVAAAAAPEQYEDFAGACGSEGSPVNAQEVAPGWAQHFSGGVASGAAELEREEEEEEEEDEGLCRAKGVPEDDGGSCSESSTAAAPSTAPTEDDRWMSLWSSSDPSAPTTEDEAYKSESDMEDMEYLALDLVNVLPTNMWPQLKEQLRTREVKEYLALDLVNLMAPESWPRLLDQLRGREAKVVDISTDKPDEAVEGCDSEYGGNDQEYLALDLVNLLPMACWPRLGEQLRACEAKEYLALDLVNVVPAEDLPRLLQRMRSGEALNMSMDEKGWGRDMEVKALQLKIAKAPPEPWEVHISIPGGLIRSRAA